MKKIITLFLILSNTFLLSAQNRNNIWIFGDSAGVSYANPSNPVPIFSGMDGRGSAVNIADTNNQLQFYTWIYVLIARGYVFNKLNVLMLSGDSLTGDGSYQELSLIPQNTNSNKFFVFQKGIAGYVDTLYSNTIDMSLDGGLGAVTQRNKPFDIYRAGDCITAIKHGNGKDWWLISKYSNPSATQFNRFYVYAIINDSIYPPIIKNFNNATDADFQKVYFNSDGTKLFLLNVGGFLAQYDFNRCTGVIDNEQIIYAEQTSNFNRILWEAALSPNDSVLYVSTSAYPGLVNRGYLLQYDLTAANVAASVDTLETFYPPIGTGAVRLAPDGKIYFSRAYESPSAWSYPYPDSMRNYINENLSVINNPNALGAACNYQPFSFYLGGKRTYYGLPNNPNYELEALAGSPCDTITSLVVIQSPIITIEAFPNPATEQIIIKINKIYSEEVSATIFDVTGKMVYQTVISSNEKIIDTQFLTKGYYLLRIKTQHQTLTKKIIKQ